MVADCSTARTNTIDRKAFLSKVDQTEAKKLREKIFESLREQGFSVQNDTIIPPDNLSKDKIRELHKVAVVHRVEQAKAGIYRKEAMLLQHIASGDEVKPEKITPYMVEVLPNSKEELLFRYASLHWSIPVSPGYGRRLRFLVFDDYNGKLIGLIGLGDPVFGLGPRDQWVGWSLSERKKRLRNVMDAFVLGAVPPYSFLLCGKLIAMLTVSDTVRRAFKRKYEGVESLIKREVHDGRLVMITTTSAFGRSSIYNRLRLGERQLHRSVGFTKGSGDFHFSNGLYGAILKFVTDYYEPTAKQGQWGTGFRNRREVINKCLLALGLSSDWAYHGIEREVFVAPLAKNTREFLRGKHSRVMWYHQSEAEIFEYFRNRWLLPRFSWDKKFKFWSKNEWAIWCAKENSHA